MKTATLPRFTPIRADDIYRNALPPFYFGTPSSGPEPGNQANRWIF